jgi:hypothetical protein
VLRLRRWRHATLFATGARLTSVAAVASAGSTLSVAAQTKFATTTCNTFNTSNPSCPARHDL